MFFAAFFYGNCGVMLIAPKVMHPRQLGPRTSPTRVNWPLRPRHRDEGRCLVLGGSRAWLGWTPETRSSMARRPSQTTLFGEEMGGVWRSHGDPPQNTFVTSHGGRVSTDGFLSQKGPKPSGRAGRASAGSPRRRHWASRGRTRWGAASSLASERATAARTKSTE